MITQRHGLLILVFALGFLHVVFRSQKYVLGERKRTGKLWVKIPWRLQLELLPIMVISLGLLVWAMK